MAHPVARSYPAAVKVALAAYKLMEEVAAAHGGVGAEEAALLAAYRRAMGLNAADLAGAQASHEPLLVEGDEGEREATIVAMAGVAHADGRLSVRERDHILEVAQRLGIGRVRAANLMNRGAGHVHLRRLQAALSRHRRGLAATALVALGASALVWWRLADGPGGGGLLQDVAAASDPALVFLHVSYDLAAPDGRRASYGGEGTGFFVGEGGDLVTCKHVVQPWKFLADRVQLLEQGWLLDPASVRLCAWHPGARVLDGRNLDRGAAWDSAAGTLQLVAIAPDHWVRASRPLTGGGHHRGRYHALDDADLALLRALDAPRGLTLAPADVALRPLDPVVVLGFPKGLALLEGELAVSAPSRGDVRKVEDSITVSADVFPGNSGGPLLDERGRVIGVAARRAGDESLGLCIRVGFVHALLEGAGRQ